MGEDEPGHRSCSEHIPIKLFVQKEHEMEDSMGLPVETGFRYGGAWQFQGYDENGLLRSRAKGDNISTSDMTVDT